MIEPIRPDDVALQKKKDIPDFVIQAWNNLIAKRSTGLNTINIKLSDACRTIREYSPDDITDTTIRQNGWLDIEPIYRDAGWDVKYDSPGYNETYEGFFSFKPK